MVIFTCSVFPHLTRIWYDYTRQVIGEETEIHIYDCGGTLKNADFPGAQIKKHPNHEHGRKIDHFLRTSKDSVVFIMDDDAFISQKSILDEVNSAFVHDNLLGLYSMHERHHWQFELAGKVLKPIGTYAFAVNAKILLKEKLSLKSKKTTELWVNSGKG
jgi:hypothetical protein